MHFVRNRTLVLIKLCNPKVTILKAWLLFLTKGIICASVTWQTSTRKPQRNLSNLLIDNWQTFNDAIKGMFRSKHIYINKWLWHTVCVFFKKYSHNNNHNNNNNNKNFCYLTLQLKYQPLLSSACHNLLLQFTMNQNWLDIHVKKVPNFPLFYDNMRLECWDIRGWWMLVTWHNDIKQTNM